jgi:hypothetical protein
MTTHAPTHSLTRFIAGMLLLFSGALFLGAAPAAAQTPAETGSELTFDHRLERLAAEIERNRVDLHVPGAALAVLAGVLRCGRGGPRGRSRRPPYVRRPAHVGRHAGQDRHPGC